MQLFSLSGILTVFFCGVLMSHYASYNVTESSRITSRQLFLFLSLVSVAGNAFCRITVPSLFLQARICDAFLYCGDIYISLCWNRCSWFHQVEDKQLKVYKMSRGQKRKKKTIQSSTLIWTSSIILRRLYHSNTNPSSCSVAGTLEVSSVITALILLGRAAFVFPLSVFTNFMNRNTQRSESITFKHQVQYYSFNYIIIRKVLNILSWSCALCILYRWLFGGRG